jgi:O-antigen/teichoic acid export membrane protein
VVILLATHGWGPMALAWSWVAGQLLTTILMNTYKPGRFRPGWNRGEAGRLLRFGLPLAGANIIAFSILNVDFIIVGRLLGATALGLYVLAFNISGWPMTVFGTVVRSVSLPSFARLRRDGASMPDRLAAALRLLASITLPVCFLLGALATPLIKTVYGNKWALAAAALVGLSILGAARVLIELISDFLISLGRTRAVFVAQLPWLAGLIVGLLVGVHTHGIAGAGAAQAIVSVGLIIPIYIFFLSRAGVSPGKVLGSLLPPTIWSLVAAAVAFVVASRASQPLVATLIGGAAGVAVYLVANGNALRKAYLAFKASRAADAQADADEADPDGTPPADGATGLHATDLLDQPVVVGAVGETT